MSAPELTCRNAWALMGGGVERCGRPGCSACSALLRWIRQSPNQAGATGTTIALRPRQMCSPQPRSWATDPLLTPSRAKRSPYHSACPCPLVAQSTQGSGTVSLSGALGMSPPRPPRRQGSPTLTTGSHLSMHASINARLRGQRQTATQLVMLSVTRRCRTLPAGRYLSHIAPTAPSYRSHPRLRPHQVIRSSAFPSEAPPNVIGSNRVCNPSLGQLHSSNPAKPLQFTG